MRAIIVGAGLAGLTYVRVLRERGAEDAAFEASDGVLRLEKDGYLLLRAAGEVPG